MRLGQQNRRPCPYFFCSAILTVYVTKRHFEDPDDQMIELIPTHEIMNDNLRPETCPASLMSFPLDDEMERLLHGMERTHYNQLLEKARRENAEPPQMPFMNEPHPRPNAVSMLPRPGNRRFGRTPAAEEDQEDWQLGGRQGFEVSGTPKPGQPIPPTTGGHAMTGRGMSNADVQAEIAAGNAEAGGAIGALTEASDPHILAALGHINDALGLTGNGYQGLESALTYIGSANEQVSDSLNGVISEYRRVMEEIQGMRGALQEAKDRLLTAVAAIERHKGEIASAIETAAEFSARLNY